MAQKEKRSAVVEDHVSGGGCPQRRLPSGADRVTSNLTPRSVRAMNNLAHWTGYTKTDILNRALQIYEFVQQVVENGGSLQIRQSESAELERLTIF
ncbi:MAG: hypothetical protein ACJ73U_45675 [Actinophytocola sp.]